MSLRSHDHEGASSPHSFALPSVLVRRLELLGQVREVGARNGLASQHIGHGLCVVLDGVALARHESGPSVRVSELLFPGDVVGETLAAFPTGLILLGLRRARVVVLSSAALDELLLSVPPAAGWLASAMALRVQRAENRQLNIRNFEVRTRLAALLSEWSSAVGSRHLYQAADGGLSQNAIADLIGANRVTVHRELQALAMRGVIYARRGEMVILNGDDLARHGRGAHPYLVNVSPKATNERASVAPVMTT